MASTDQGDAAARAKSSVQNKDEKTQKKNEKQKRQQIEHLQMVLDDLVSVNSLFTFAMFVGISIAGANPQTLQPRKECQASHQTKMVLLFDEVVSFVCFLLSSLVATALKMNLSTYLMSDPNNRKRSARDVNDGVRNLMIMLSMTGSILGCVYLTMSMANVVRVLLGNVTCGESDTLLATGTLIAVNVLALLIYVPSMMRAVHLSHAKLELN
ncbi:hypothetical protein EUGRSUZ_L00548 [Eucalyptus grandis]|uniref:PGG domain-containing protein n=1 Tax=Eucalyptus grandis TaxID=71139 RepID=A0A058ZX96_EUCGR|nr:hypothetical protein EUGRSUZ_L00548 [Eucalyptus grandis]